MKILDKIIFVAYFLAFCSILYSAYRYVDYKSYTKGYSDCAEFCIEQMKDLGNNVSEQLEELENDVIEQMKED